MATAVVATPAPTPGRLVDHRTQVLDAAASSATILWDSDTEGAQARQPGRRPSAFASSKPYSMSRTAAVAKIRT